ncbi:MAG: HEAT repeat domain-containing protein [Myxococcota bacterium]
MALPLAAWVGITVWVKLTLAREVPVATLLPLVGRGLFGSLGCAFGGCDADLIDGMTVSTFDDRLTEGTLVSLDVDEHGRVLLAESHRRDAGAEDNRRHDWLAADLAAQTLDDRLAYQADAIARGAVADPDHFTREADRLVVLTDDDGDGRADRRSELGRWNEPLGGLIAGVEAREGTIWVANIPSILRILDRDYDGAAEEERELVRGFGVKTSLGGHDLHGFAWGPDGRLYVAIGDRGYDVRLPDGRSLVPPLGQGRGAVFRMQPDGSGFEVFATGLRNPQELAFDDDGNLFTGDNNGDGGDPARIVYVVEGGDSGWAMPYQSLADPYVRGPWMAERLYDLPHPTQPAWIVPPVAHIANGPAGFVHYPGLGLPERYANHFFLCDYAYVYGQSGIWSFALEPRGAGFALVDRDRFIWSVLAPDFDFAWDGRMFAALFDQFGDSRGVAAFEHAASRRDVRVATLERLAREPVARATTASLIERLDFPDQRLRLRAQFELARRGEVASLAGLARDAGAARIARQHAIWALGQLGEVGLAALAAPADWIDAAPDEIRAQLARVAGEAGVGDWAERLRAWLGDPAPRVRFFAAQSLGQLGDRESVEPLIALLRENADRDPYLRHAAVRALDRIGALDTVWRHADDADRAVRLGVLLVLRRAGDARVAALLGDPDPGLVVEAARAIYDGPIDAAMPALAARLPRLEPVAAGDREVGEALHRRAIGANVRLRNAVGATALARYAADARQNEALRKLALEQLAQYAAPPPRDLTMGFHRPLPPIDVESVAGVLYAEGRALVDSSLGARALEIASAFGVSPLADEELVALVEAGEAAPRERVAALEALRTRSARSRVAGTSDRARRDGARAGAHALGDPAARRVAERGIADPDAEVRIAGRALLATLDPEAGLVTQLVAAREGETVTERQHAWRWLGAAQDARAREAIAAGIDAWLAGTVDDAVGLDLLEAGIAQGEATLAGRARRLLEPTGEDPVGPRRWALAGGDAVAGRQVFQTVGDCQRCHGDPRAVAGATGHGGRVGPDLAGVARRGADYVLESMLVPNARIAKGFPSPSGMPPVGRVLEPSALRDLVAYVMTLE